VAELERVAAEAAAKAAAERANEDVSLRAIKARGAEERRRTLEAITSVFGHLASGATSLLGNPRQLATLLGSVLTVVAGGFLAREGATLARQVLEARLGKPKLVRETSRASRGLLAGLLLAPLDLLVLSLRLAAWLSAWLLGPRTWQSRARRLTRWATGKGGGEGDGEDAAGQARAAAVAAAAAAAGREVDGYLEGVVLPSALKERVTQLAISTRNAKRNQVPYRHLLLYGPPGTGKTMVAQRLAAASGMDYALMSGGDVGPLGKDAVTELHALFRWAAGSKAGLLLFIDEAEAFLGSRSRSAMSEELRNALNALLYQTGTQSYSFMMVLATNRAEDLDSAVLDRMDESLYFGLPSVGLRQMLVRQYFDGYVDAFTAATRRAKEAKRWGARRAARAVLGHAVADLGLPPPLRVKFATGSGSGDSEAEAKAACLGSVAERIEGFSGREISKLMVALQSVAYGSANNELTGPMVEGVVTLKIDEHARKEKMVATGHTSPMRGARVQQAPAGNAANHGGGGGGRGGGSGGKAPVVPGSPIRDPSARPRNP